MEQILIWGVTIIRTVLMLGVIILIHELGHFLTAKYFKMPVLEFALGMGPKIKSFIKNGTEYSMRAIPVGGFVNIDGMDPDNEVENGFNTKSKFARFIVIVAGVIMNFILAYFIVVGLFITIPQEIINEKAVIGQVSEKSPSHNILKEGDKVLEINGDKILMWLDISKSISKLENNDLELLIERDGVTKKLLIKTYYNENLKRRLVGIGPSTIMEKYGFVEGVKNGSIRYLDLFGIMYDGIKKVFTLKVSKEEIAGPIGIVRMVKNNYEQKISGFILLTALLSLSVGIFNLLPFPALDGGRLLFIIFEMFGLKVNKKFEERVHQVGLIILLCLIVLISYNDVANIFRVK